jgi:hypothetical protein
MWVFAGSVTEKQALPLGSSSYACSSTEHGVNWDRVGSVLEWLDQASSSVTVTSFLSAVEILNNYGFGTKHAAYDGSDVDGEIGWIMFHKDEQHISAVLGCSPDKWESIRGDLELALTSSDLVLRFGFDGGFSRYENKPHSKQPTVEQFRAGRPLPLNPEFSMRLQKRREEWG